MKGGAAFALSVAMIAIAGVAVAAVVHAKSAGGDSSNPPTPAGIGSLPADPAQAIQAALGAYGPPVEQHLGVKGKSGRLYDIVRFQKDKSQLVLVTSAMPVTVWGVRVEPGVDLIPLVSVVPDATATDDLAQFEHSL